MFIQEKLRHWRVIRYGVLPCRPDARQYAVPARVSKATASDWTAEGLLIFWRLAALRARHRSMRIIRDQMVQRPTEPGGECRPAGAMTG